MKKKATSFDLPRRLADQPASVASFVYAPAPGWIPPPPVISPLTRPGVRPTAEDPSSTSSAAESIEAVQRKIQEAWERGVREGESRARSEQQAQLEEVRKSVGAAILKFEQERADYFRRVEPEVVQLALAIVRKILYRESQLDPLLLRGLVRVALERAAASQSVRLRARPEQLATWTAYFSQARELSKPPELVGDASLAAGQVQIESEMGMVDLSIELQLKEIEQGLFDLLAQKPCRP